MAYDVNFYVISCFLSQVCLNSSSVISHTGLLMAVYSCWCVHVCVMYPAVLLHLPSLWYLCLGIFQRKMLTLYLLSLNTLYILWREALIVKWIDFYDVTVVVGFPSKVANRVATINRVHIFWHSEVDKHLFGWLSTFKLSGFIFKNFKSYFLLYLRKVYFILLEVCVILSNRYID